MSSSSLPDEIKLEGAIGASGVGTGAEVAVLLP